MTIVAAALFGAMLGFAPFNRPVTKIFLGDVGSLPIGLLVGWCCCNSPGISNSRPPCCCRSIIRRATVTLLRRMARGEPFWAAHRTHLSARHGQRLSVAREVGEVFALNIVLAALAVGSVVTSLRPSPSCSSSSAAWPRRW